MKHTTDPDARLIREGLGKEAKLCPMGHIMIENRHGLIVDARLTEANGTAEREAALDMIKDKAGRGSTIGADKNYDTADFVAGCRTQGCVPHVAQNNTRRRAAIAARTTRHAGYKVSQSKRKRIEEPFGGMKTVGIMRKTRHRGRELGEWFFVLTAAADNLIRMAKILPTAGGIRLTATNAPQNGSNLQASPRNAQTIGYNLQPSGLSHLKNGV